MVAGRACRSRQFNGGGSRLTHGSPVLTVPGGGALDWVRRPCARAAFRNLLLVEHKRLVARGATEQHTRVVYRQRFAVGRYDTMDVANDLAILLEIKVPSVCIDLLRERRIRGPGRGLLLLLAVAVLHPVRHLLAICACQLLVERVQPVGFGIDTGS